MTADFGPKEPEGSPPEPIPDEMGRRRLPPPAFPPGVRKVAKRQDGAERSPDGSVVFIAPDDPMPERMEPGYISPDAPIPSRPPRAEATISEEEDDEEGVVTGMSHEAHLDLEELTRLLNPYVHELVDAVAKLAEALKRQGEGGLEATSDMTRFEQTLRAHCVGYLTGRRAGDEGG